MKLAWLSTWSRKCGIADYSQALWPAMKAEALKRGCELELISLDECRRFKQVLDRIDAIQPEVLHVQHEYGIFGGKNPPRYRFPVWVRRIRGARPGLKCVATAHTVLSPDYAFPVAGRGWQAPLRAAANAALLSRLHRLWGARTWGALDGVIVHSGLQAPWVQASGCARTQVIPHFVPQLPPGPVPRRGEGEGPVVLVFGFLTPEKGQDLALEALARLPAELLGKARLVLAGGVRRPSDQAYADRLQERIGELGLGARARITGFLKASELGEQYAKATLVLAPFRETTGSGSLAQAFARGAAILASDLPLNRELVSREPGCLEFFRAGDPGDCARRLAELLYDPARRDALGTSSRAYAKRQSPARVAEMHFDFYSML